MTTKKAEKAKATVRVVTHGDEDEVFITSDEPYVNKVVHAKHGVFKDGEFALDGLEKKEQEARAEQVEPAARVIAPAGIVPIKVDSAE